MTDFKLNGTSIRLNYCELQNKKIINRKKKFIRDYSL